MLLVFNTAQLGRLLLQILSKTHLIFGKKDNSYKNTVSPKCSDLSIWANIFTHKSANTHGHSNTHLQRQRKIPKIAILRIKFYIKILLINKMILRILLPS